jgi:hypothetical protein
VIVLASLALAVQVLAVPLPMETVRERIGTRSTPVGLWNVVVTGKAGEVVSREAVVMATAAFCRSEKAPMPLFLTKEQAWPIIVRKAGAKWKLLQRLASLAGAGVAIAAFPPAAAAGPVFELLSERAASHIPDISSLSAELPASIVIPASGGVTLPVWSARMRRQPVPLGPFEVR